MFTELGPHDGHPDICCRDKAAKCMQSRRFLEYIDGKFLTHMVKEPVRGKNFTTTPEAAFAAGP